MGNSLSNLVQTKIVPGLYKQYIAGSTTSWMEGNATGVEYNGGKYVMMHELSVDGLGDYDRNLGYPRGSINGAKKQYELKMDRGREFLIDAADNDETGFLVSAANVMAEFQSRHVIPEVDSYRYSKIYDIMTAGDYSANVSNTAITAANITETLLDDIADVQDEMGTSVPLVVIMSGKVQKYFGRDFSHSLDFVSFRRGEFYTKVKAVDGNPFIIVPSARLKSSFDFLDGVSTNETAGGFKASNSAKDMKWIITPATGPAAVAKIDKTRAFTPDEYQSAHAWKVDYRLFHDLWMLPDAQRCTMIRTGDIG